MPMAGAVFVSLDRHGGVAEAATDAVPVLGWDESSRSVLDRLAEALQMKATLIKDAQSISSEAASAHHKHWLARALPAIVLCTLMLALLCYFLYREHKESKLPTQAPPPNAREKKEEKRNPHFDNMKFFIIFLVVAAHFLQGCPSGTLPRQAIEIFVHSFGVPLFAVVSGAVSVLEMDDLKYRRTLHCIMLYFLFQSVYSIIDVIMLKVHPHAKFPTIGNLEIKSINTFQDWAAVVAGHAFYHLWYIKALFFWRLCAPCVMQFHGSLGAVTVLGILVSYADHSGGDWPRAVSFFPFFVLGLWIKRHHLLKNLEDMQKSSPTVVRAAMAGILAIHVAVCFWIGWGSHDLPFEAWLTHVHDPNKAASSTIWAPFIRVGVYIYQALVSLAVYLMIPQTESRYTRLGAHTIVPYLLHPMFMYVGIYSGLYDQDLFGGSLGSRLFQQCLCVVIGVVVTAFLLMKPVFDVCQHIVYVCGMKSEGGYLMRYIPKKQKHGHVAAPAKGGKA